LRPCSASVPTRSMLLFSAPPDCANADVHKAMEAASDNRRMESPRCLSPLRDMVAAALSLNFNSRASVYGVQEGAMNWMDVLRQYRDVPATLPPQAADDFQAVAREVPREDLSHGI